MHFLFFFISILWKQKGPFQVFSSTFYATRETLGDSFKLPIFETLCDHLMPEQCRSSG